jgi:hypothetical protein
VSVVIIVEFTESRATFAVCITNNKKGDLAVAEFTANVMQGDLTFL